MLSTYFVNFYGLVYHRLLNAYFLVVKPVYKCLTASLHAWLQSLALLTNVLGSSLPIPMCISTNIGAHHIALLGYFPPLLVLATVAVYVVRLVQVSKLCRPLTSIIICSARSFKMLSERSSLNGITLLSLLIYKYIADTSFILISCSSTSTGWVSFSMCT